MNSMFAFMCVRHVTVRDWIILPLLDYIAVIGL